MKQENTDYKIDDLTKKPPEEIVEPIPEEQLNLEAKMRAKKRPLLEKIIKLLKRDDEPYREIVINVEPFEKRVALLADGVMQKFEIERPGDESMVGAIFKGKIQNLEPGLKAAFVDIGQPKNAFLHYWDIFPSTTDNTTYEIVRENRSKEQKEKRPKIFRQGYSREISNRNRDNRTNNKDSNWHKRPEDNYEYSNSRPLSRLDALRRAMRNFPQNRGQKRAR